MEDAAISNSISVLKFKIEGMTCENCARQASEDFQIPGLPFTRIFDGHGNLLGQVYGNFIEKAEDVLLRHGALIVESNE